MAVTSSGSGKCPVHGSRGSLFNCTKCGDVRCWSWLMKIKGSTSKPCIIWGEK